MPRSILLLLLAIHASGTVLGYSVDSKMAMEPTSPDNVQEMSPYLQTTESLAPHNYVNDEEVYEVVEDNKDKGDGNNTTSGLNNVASLDDRQDLFHYTEMIADRHPDEISHNLRTRKLMAVDNGEKDEEENEDGEDEDEDKDEEDKSKQKNNIPPETDKATPGLETDTDDPQGVFLSIEALNALVPGPGVLKSRLDMPLKHEIDDDDQTINTREKRESVGATHEPNFSAVPHEHNTSPSPVDYLHTFSKTEKEEKLTVGNQINRSTGTANEFLKYEQIKDGTTPNRSISNSGLLRRRREGEAREENQRDLFENEPPQDKELSNTPQDKELSYTERYDTKQHQAHKKPRTKEWLQNELNSIEILMNATKNKLGQENSKDKPYSSSQMDKDLKKIDHDIHIHMKQESDPRRRDRMDGGWPESGGDLRYNRQNNKSLPPRFDQKNYHLNIYHNPPVYPLDTDYMDYSLPALRQLLRHRDVGMGVRRPKRWVHSLKLLEELLWIKKENDELKSKARIIEREMKLRDFARKWLPRRKVAVSIRHDGDQGSIKQVVEENHSPHLRYLDGGFDMQPEIGELQGKTRNTFNRLQNDLEELKLKMNAREKLAGSYRIPVTDEDEYSIPLPLNQRRQRPQGDLVKDELEDNEGTADFEKRLLTDIMRNHEKSDDIDKDIDDVTNRRYDDIVNHRLKRSLLKRKVKEVTETPMNNRTNTTPDRNRYGEKTARTGYWIFNKFNRRVKTDPYYLIRLCRGKSNSQVKLIGPNTTLRDFRGRGEKNTTQAHDRDRDNELRKSINDVLEKCITKLRESIINIRHKLYKKLIVDHMARTVDSKEEKTEPNYHHGVERVIKKLADMKYKTRKGQRNIMKMKIEEHPLYRKGLARNRGMQEGGSAQFNNRHVSEHGNNGETKTMRTRRSDQGETQAKKNMTDSDIELGLTKQFTALLKLIPESQLEKDLEAKIRQSEFKQKNAFDVNASILKLDKDEEEDANFIRDAIEAGHLLDDNRVRRHTMAILQRSITNGRKGENQNDAVGFMTNEESGPGRIKRSENSTIISDSTESDAKLGNETIDSSMQTDGMLLDKSVLQRMDAYEGEQENHKHDRKREAESTTKHGNDNSSNEAKQSITNETEAAPDEQIGKPSFLPQSYRKLAKARDTLRWLQLIEGKPRSEAKLQILNNMADVLLREDDLPMGTPLDLDKERTMHGFEKRVEKLMENKNATDTLSLLKEAVDDFNENSNSHSLGYVDRLYLKKRRAPSIGGPTADSNSVVIRDNDVNAKDPDKDKNRGSNKNSIGNEEYYYPGDRDDGYIIEDDSDDDDDDEEIDVDKNEIINEEDDEGDDTKNNDDTTQSKETGIELDDNGNKQEPEEPFALIQKDKIQKKNDSVEYFWGAWSPCSVSCGVGQRFRSNMCGSDQPCVGRMASTEMEVCSDKFLC